MLTSGKNISTKKLERKISASGTIDKDWGNFIIVYWRQIAYAMAALILIFLSAYLFIFRSQQHQEMNYLKAEKDFQQLVLSKPIDQTKLHQFEDILARNPQLQQKYQAPLAQELIQQGNWAEGINYADEAIKKASNIQSLPFEEFSKASLAIGQKQYKDALERSLKLMQFLSNQAAIAPAPEYQILAAYNLLRIAVLQQQIGSFREEADAWANYKKYTVDNFGDQKESQNHLKNFALYQAHFGEGEVSLSDYIVHRESILRGNSLK